jgi:hypothetical protein
VKVNGIVFDDGKRNKGNIWKGEDIITILLSLTHKWNNCKYEKEHALIKIR